MAKLNAEVDTVTAAKYRVKSYPTILVLQKDGGEVDRLVGYSRAPEYIAEVEDYLAGRNTLASMEAQANAKAGDPKFVHDLAEKYFGHGLYDQARLYYQKFIELDPKNVSGSVDDVLYTLARMSRKEKDYVTDRKYAQIIVDHYAESDMYRPALLEIAGAWRREGELKRARALYLDYAKQYPDDEDAPFAREQADTLQARLAAKAKGA